MSPRSAKEILERAKIKEKTSPRLVHRNDAEALFRAIGETKLMAPPTNCLAPIGESLLEQGLRKQVNADLVVATTRSPAVYRGNPFQVEVALAYGGDLAADQPISVYRFANRVPLLYQQGACAITKAVVDTSWRNYELQQSRGALPVGPLMLMVHIASVWVPFTSESKEAIAHYPEILKEIKLAVQECGRKLAIHIRRGKREREAERKASYIEKYIPHIGIALKEILGLSERQEKKIVTTPSGHPRAVEEAVMRRLIDITPRVTAGIAVWPGDTDYRVSWAARMEEGGSCNVASITTTPHVGAHADGPLHFTQDGPPIGGGGAVTVHRSLPGDRRHRLGGGRRRGGLRLRDRRSHTPLVPDRDLSGLREVERRLCLHRPRVSPPPGEDGGGAGGNRYPLGRSIRLQGSPRASYAARAGHPQSRGSGPIRGGAGGL